MNKQEHVVKIKGEILGAQSAYDEAHRIGLGNMLVSTRLIIALVDYAQHSDKRIAKLEGKLELFDTYNPMHSAPMDGTEIIGLYQDGEARIFWSEKPVCILGSRNCSFPAGWATCGGDTDYNLPMDEPLAWSDV